MARLLVIVYIISAGYGRLPVQNFAFHLNEKGRSKFQLESWNQFQRRELPREVVLEDGAIWLFVFERASFHVLDIIVYA
jgi:hypothetical protein